MSTKTVTRAKASAAKRTTSPRVTGYARLFSDALAGKFGPVLKGFYEKAVVYHTGKKTKFPRERVKADLLSVKDATAFLEARKATSIPAADPSGQRLFDQMVLDSRQAKMGIL